jgi:hypothetical protein
MGNNGSTNRGWAYNPSNNPEVPMTNRLSFQRGALVALVAFLLAMPATAQEADGEWTQAYTPWGDPDLQGVYTFSTSTPLERPESVGDRETYTPEEIAELEAQAADRRTDEDGPARVGDVGTYNRFWTSNEKGRLVGTTSLIIDPPDGRLPPITERGQIIREQRAASEADRTVGEAPFEELLYRSWMDFPPYERCVGRPMPRISHSYNHGVQILQSPGYVVIHYESMHDVRIIPLDGRPHVDDSVRLWNGDSRGHWEGNTLVVDWSNFTDKQLLLDRPAPAHFPQGNMRFTERFTMIDADTLGYEVTVDDPTIWTQPWTFILPWRSDDPNYQRPEDLYEFACHEGNYRMMQNSLRGSRSLEEQNR